MTEELPGLREGDERLCPNLVSITGVLASWGGYAEYLRVHARQLMEGARGPCPAEEAASLVDCGATAANSVRVALESSPRRALILGAGPIGYMGRNSCASPTSGAGRPAQRPRREALARIGHDVVASMPQASAPVDVVIDCTGSADVLAPGLQALGPQRLLHPGRLRARP